MSSKPSQLGTHLWLVFMKAYQALHEHDLRSIESTGLCRTDFTTLELLLHKGPQPVNVIGETIQLTSGSITTAVDRLEKKGLVERQASASDRRIRVVHLTVTGQKLIAGVFDAHQKALEVATSGLNPEEQQIFIELTKKLGKEAQRLLRRVIS